MAAIHFKTHIEQGQNIPLPEGVVVPIGPAEVIVIPEAAISSATNVDDVPRIPQIALDLARFAEENGPSNLPPDYAVNHDHYLHGAPKWIDFK
jgi:hypothetical protein